MTSKDTPTDEPKGKHDARAEKPTEPAAPPVVEYPKMLYHPDGRQLTVQSADEEATAKADGFADTPAAPDAPRSKRA